MSNRTAWSKSASSVPSDRIKPAQHSSHPQPTSGSGKRKGNASKEPVKSKEIIHLETLLHRVRSYNGTEKDPHGGCFCQAREHALSSYTPICRTCGLILCVINPPYMACPHCGTGLLPTESLRTTVVSRLETQIAETIQKELDEKQKREEEARRAAGAFPTLSATPNPSATITASTTPSPGTMLRSSTNEPRKVISLNSKTKKVTVSAFVPSPSVSRPASRSSVENAEEVTRVPPPPAEATHVKRHPDSSRPWMNFSMDTVIYLPAPPKAVPSQGDGKRRRKNRRDQSSANSVGS